MIHENIKQFRKAKGMTQEELAVKLHVVRQTVSKWEKGLSVPDADVVIQLADLLGVSVHQLLGTSADTDTSAQLSEELARLNEQLARKNQREKRLQQANQKRGWILFSSFLAMLVALTVQNEVVSILLVGACILAAVVVLYRNLALLTSITTEDMKLGVLRTTTLFNVGVLMVGILFAVLTASGLVTVSKDGEKLLAMLLISCVMLFAGIVSPKLPYNRYTGLRLPWTAQDGDTWNLAHRVIGYISLPVVLLYIACTFTVEDFELVTLAAMVVWIGVPGVISYVFYRKKLYGKLGK